jgi:DNA-binding transcriptional regulator YiaG
MAAPKPRTSNIKHQTFRTIVRNWRSARQLSRAEAGRQLGVPYRTLEDWEAGKKIPTGIRRRLLEQMFSQPLTPTAKNK